MDVEKYTRSISLHCPTCASDQFEIQNATDEAIEFMKCASCGRQMTKNELLHENSENISIHASEIGEEALKDFADDFKKSLKAAFGGNKYIKIK